MTILTGLSLKTAVFAVVMLFVGMIAASFASDKIHVPSFPDNAEWINTERPLTMNELKGRAVLLDFWTYCCINCMHVLPDLARLEKKYGDRLVVVGVHSAKFDGEKDTENIRDAVKRYAIHHPVINDHGFVMWRALGVRAWPTLVLIDTEGYIVGSVSGEGNYDTLDSAIADVLSKSPNTPALMPPLPIAVENADVRRDMLSYPGKVFTDNGGKRLFIADSGNNRILIVSPESGAIRDVIGNGAPGLGDGGYETASFNNPQGMAMIGDVLYVADTGNHALRAVDLDARRVRTVTGDGKQARWRSNGGTAGSARLNSPWDVEVLDARLYIAMAGPHQIWMYDPATHRISTFAGSGREDIADGALDSAALAQPSGIVAGGGDLFFVDSETSSVRRIDMKRERVVTLAGTGLFDFGHRDGALSRALFQHPLGIAWRDGSLFVADTYNNRIRRIDLADNTVTTIAGSAEDGLADGIGLSSRFDEPGGLHLSDGRLFVADTNNHAMRIIDTANGTVSMLPVHYELPYDENGGLVSVRITAPAGYALTDEAPSKAYIGLSDGSRVEPEKSGIENGAFVSRFTLDRIGGLSDVTVNGGLYVCGENDDLCRLAEFAFNARINASGVDGVATVRALPPE